VKETEQNLEFIAVVKVNETKLNLDFIAGVFEERNLRVHRWCLLEQSHAATPGVEHQHLVHQIFEFSTGVEERLTKPNLEFTTGIASKQHWLW